MSRGVRRHSGNYAAVVLLLFGAAIGLDWLLIRLGFAPIAGCALRPFLYLVMGLAAGTWMMTAGASCSACSPPRDRPEPPCSSRA